MKKERKLRLRRIAARAAARREEREGETLTGIIAVTPGGFGFVTPDNAPEENREDIFVPAKFIGYALDGDQVVGYVGSQSSVDETDIMNIDACVH